MPKLSKEAAQARVLELQKKIDRYKDLIADSEVSPSEKELYKGYLENYQNELLKIKNDNGENHRIS